MPRFQVVVQGAPVFFFSSDSGKVERLGFLTARYVNAKSAQEASEIAQKVVLNDLKDTRNPPDLPVRLNIEGVHLLSWFESLRHPRSADGFIFYPEDSNEAG